MIRRPVILLAAAALTLSCAAKAPLSREIVRSEMARNPEASYIDGLQGKLKWNYTTGLELKAMLDVYKRSFADAQDDKESSSCHSERSEESIVAYVDAWYDAIIDSTGRIGVNYKKSNWSTDHICPGRTLLSLCDLTGKEKYRKAMDSLYVQLQGQPRTPEGGFWHKKIYPGQMWLDGLYMAQPFYAEYTARYVTDPSERERNFEDIALQFSLAWDHCYDPSTGLLRHAWDSSRQMFWADPSTGQSAHAWGRACGWYAMALLEVIPHFPEGELRQGLIDKLNTLCVNIMNYADPATGMWYQVLDRPGEEGNWLESTASAMFTYALLKGCRMGWIKDIDIRLARSKYRSLLDTFVTSDADGLVNLNDCCEVAGLGGKENRSGTYDYYIHEKVRSNDPKGIGPLVWAALEYERK